MGGIAEPYLTDDCTGCNKKFLPKGKQEKMVAYFLQYLLIFSASGRSGTIFIPGNFNILLPILNKCAIINKTNVL